MTDLRPLADTPSSLRTLDYRVLGQLEARLGGTPVALGGRKQRGVLAVLIAAAGRSVSVDALLVAIYGEDAAPGGKATLHTYVSNLRRLLGDVIVRQGDAYFLDCGEATIDATVFEEACRRAAAIEEPERASAELRRALSLWRGHAYADIEANGHLDGEITRLGEMRLAALEARIDADLRAGRHREVVGELDALTAEYPYRETLRALQMLALYRCGRQAESLRAYSRARDLLVESLGIDPSAELQDLERRILAQDRELLIDVAPVVQRRAVLVADLDDAGWLDPTQREAAYGAREDDLAAAAARESGTRLTPKGSAGYVIFDDAINAVRAARSIVNDRTRIAIDVGDLEIGDEEPAGPPLARGARLVAVAHPGQVLLSSAAHDALAAGAHTGWAAESLGQFEIAGLDPATHVYQLVGRGFGSDFPALRLDRLPPAVPGGLERSVPGYEVRELIGSGELGEVHRAYQPSVGREVALRIFGREMVCHPRFVRRFEAALQRMTRVEHPHVVPLLDYWREPQRAVIVTRLMTAGSLVSRIPPEGLGPGPSLEIAEKLASAVASAHRHGVVHGRIRPDNVLFDVEDNPYLADLGIDEICSGVITFASTAYDAPERLGGRLATPAADIYSLGVLVHHMLSGSSPDLDRGLDLIDHPAAEVIVRATDLDPGRRHESVEALLSELRDVLAGPARPSPSVFVPSRNPYRGLEAFEQADADDFYGRDAAVAEMVAILRDEPLLVVVGPSGAGKSSAVKAGLLPALAAGAIEGSDRWLVTDLVPGREPFEQLAAALERVATNDLADVVGELVSGSRSLAAIVDELAPGIPGLVVVIDQLEELFTQTVDETDRRRLLQMLIDVAQAPSTNIRLVATLRADFFDRPLAYPGFGEAIQRRTVALGAMSAAEMAEAVRLPAVSVGVEIEPAVIDQIVAEAEHQPGALPLVQHTLAELFRARTTNTITIADLAAVGGLAGAIGRKAEQIYRAFDGRRRDAAEQVFLRLVSVTEEHGDTRRRVRRSELEQVGIGSDDLDAVLAEYGDHRLLTFDRDPATRTPTVELAHEALLGEWRRFADWVDDAREDLLSRRRVESAAADWTNAEEDPSFLYGGGRLELAEAWAAGSRFELGDAERRFLDASRQKMVRDRAARSRRRRVVTGVLASIAVVAIAMAAIVFVQRQRAQEQADETRSRQLIELAASAIEEDPERAILLGLAAAELTDDRSTELVSVLHRGTQSMRLTDRFEGLMSWSLDMSPDGSLFAVDRLDGTGFMLVDASTGEIVHDVATDDPLTEWALAFDPSGSTLAVAHSNEDDPSVAPMELFDVASGRRVASFTGPPGFYCCSVDFDATGRWLGALGDTGAAVWDVVAGGDPKLFGPAYDFELGADGTSVVVGDGSALTVFDIASGRQVHQIQTPTGIEYWDFELDPTGTLAALVSRSEFGRRVDVVAIDTGEVRATLGLRDPYLAQFSPDGRRLAVTSEDSLIRVYDTDDFTERYQLAGTSGAPTQIMFAPDSSRVVSGRPGEIRVWDLSPAGFRSLGNFQISEGALHHLVVAPGGGAAYATVYTASGTRSSVHRVDLATGSDEKVLDDVPYYFSTRPRVSPDASVVATMDDENQYSSELVPLAGGESTRLGRCESVRAFDRTGRVMAVDAHLLCREQGQPSDGVSRVVDRQTGEILLEVPERAIYAADFGPPAGDGLPQLAAFVEFPTEALVVYDLITGETLGSYSPDGDFTRSLAISPDGTRLALLMESGRLEILDVSKIEGDGDQSAAIVVDVPAHSAGSKEVAFSEGGLLATASSLDGLRLWSSDGDPLGTVPTRQEDPPTFAFAPGTDTLYYEDSDGVVRRFEIDFAAVEQLARSLLTRGFTPQECTRYFPDEACPTFGVPAE